MGFTASPGTWMSRCRRHMATISTRISGLSGQDRFIRRIRHGHPEYNHSISGMLKKIVNPVREGS
jgi:hypothetical protein